MTTLESLTNQCVKCGLCKDVCPTYPYIQKEDGFARGRIALAQLVLKGEIEIDSSVSTSWNQCAMCRRCEWICPNGVEFKEIMVHSRSLQREKEGDKLIKKAGLFALNALQSSPGRLALKLAGKASKFLPKEIKVPFPTGAVKFMPKPSGKAFDLRGKTFKAKEEKSKLLFFTGCLIDAFYTKTGESVIKLLNKAGYTVTIPKDIRCCGAPHYYSGNLEAFEKLKEHNIREIQSYDFDAIVVACPTCGGALSEDYGKSWKVQDFAEIIQKESLSFKGSGKKVTFHVPCHSYSAMKVNSEVFYDCIKKVNGDTLQRAPRDKSCCGFAGLFSITNPEISNKAQEQKINDLDSTGANLILTTCPGCVLNLND
ncbi:MAG: (Fe-S)-binding protein, partial [Aquificaceae bacterium]|nr:(Fe-S)-binding protein [Aquificaceae bacterium]